MPAAADPSPATPSPDSSDPNPLLRLLGRCVVAVHAGENFRGTGFFVAPGEVLTCAHVVQAREDLVVEWEAGSFPATVVKALPDLEPGDRRAGFYPLPDVALLQLDARPADHPCVPIRPHRT
jgi:hypothetical protein